MKKVVIEKKELTEEEILEKKKRGIVIDKMLEIYSRVTQEKHEQIKNKTSCITDCLNIMSKELKIWKENNNY